MQTGPISRIARRNRVRRRAIIIALAIEAPLMLLTVTACFGRCRVSHFSMAIPLYVAQLPSTIAVDWILSALQFRSDNSLVALSMYFGLIMFVQTALIAVAMRLLDDEPF